MRVVRLRAAALLGAGLAALAQAANGPGAGFRSAQESSGPSCYNNRFNGIYKTFSPGDIEVTTQDWRLVHPGPCQCEGKDVTQCQEPGDNG